MKIGKYISELLFENDSVILPGFGEFSTKYIPARFVPELKKVEKPSKVIAFGDKKKEDDNVLSEYIAKKENLDNEKAKSFINAFVKEMNDTLKAGKSVELENVGKFSPGVGDSITFEPDKSINYLKETQGMGSAREPVKKPSEQPKPSTDRTEKKSEDLPPKEKETPKQEPVKPQASTPKTEPSKPEPKKPEEEKESEPVGKTHGITPREQKPETKSQTSESQKEPAKPTYKKEPPASTKATPSAKASTKATPDTKEQKPSLSPAMKWMAFVAIPLLVIIIIFAFNFRYIIGDGVPDRESAGFFDRVKNIFVESEEPMAMEPDPIDTEEIEEEIDEPDPGLAEAEEEVTPREPDPDQPVYHIVVGSFAEEHNAVILAEDLQFEGAENASVFEQTRDGLHRVSYGYYHSMEEAERELQKVKETVNTDAWIVKR